VNAQDLRTLVMEHAAAISHAERAPEAQIRLARWARQWRRKRDGAQTLMFSSIAGWDVTGIRTTGK
jgi:hypothetical protein